MNEGVEIRPFAGVEFGVERFTIGADFEGAAARRDEGKRRDPFAELENFSRQTDGFRRVVSNRAILDSDFGFHRSLLSSGKAIDAAEQGQHQLGGLTRLDRAAHKLGRIHRKTATATSVFLNGST